MTEVIAYRLNELVAGESINVRPRDEDVADLVASIRAHGLLQPLVGRDRGDGKIEIVDGNRRLMAMQIIDAEEDSAPEWEQRTIEWVHVVLRPQEDEADAFEISLAANVLRKPLHPVREFEAFADLIEKGKDKQAVADHFGIPLRAVEQRLALGRLHPDVRAAWLEGRVTSEAARAFTLAAPADQATYLAKALQTQQHWLLRDDQVRRSFTQNTMGADRAEALFVGREAYLAAGGTFVSDLFAEHPDFADGGLVVRLAEERLSAEAQRIQEEEGWGAVLFGEAAQGRYSWERITKPALQDSEKPARAIEIERRLQAIAERRQQIEDNLDTREWDEDDEPPEVTAQLREDDALATENDRLDAELAQLTERAMWLKVPEAKRAKAVTVIEIARGGVLSIARGYLKDQKPKPAPKPSAIPAPAPQPSADGEEAPEPTRLSAALMDELALTATRAAAHVVAAEPRLALALFVASAATWGSPIRFKSEGRSEGPGLPWSGRDYDSKKATTFNDVLKSTLLLSTDELLVHTAKCVAHMLDFTSKAIVNNSMDALKPEAAQAVRAALPERDHREALVRAFDAADYFSKAPKQEAVMAIAECGDDPGKYAKLKKADLGATAARLANARAWLPPVLRGEVFDAVLPAELEVDGEGETEPGEVPAGDDTPQPAESMIEATQRIWQDQERKRLEALKTPEIRAELEAHGIKVPFGKSKNQMIDMLLEQPAETEEAA